VRGSKGKDGQTSLVVGPRGRERSGLFKQSGKNIHKVEGKSKRHLTPSNRYIVPMEESLGHRS